MTPQEISDNTSDAYSYDRYGQAAWLRAIYLLTAVGYTESQVIITLRSKYMRWAADSFSKQRDGFEECNGGEIISYRDMWGIDIDDLVDGD